MASPPQPPSREAIGEAATALRRILTVIEEGEMTAATPGEVALVRRLQGALAAMETLSEVRPVPDDPSG